MLLKIITSERGNPLDTGFASGVLAMSQTWVGFYGPSNGESFSVFGSIVRMLLPFPQSPRLLPLPLIHEERQSQGSCVPALIFSPCYIIEFVGLKPSSLLVCGQVINLSSDSLWHM
jgi:hypothetical protein